MNSRSRLETLKDQIDKLDMNEHRQIYNIIKRINKDTVLTRTQQGVLITSDTLSIETLEEIDRYITFCIDQRKRMDEDMKTRKKYERMV
jgi:hypothetical protein